MIGEENYALLRRVCIESMHGRRSRLRREPFALASVRVLVLRLAVASSSCCCDSGRSVVGLA